MGENVFKDTNLSPKHHIMVIGLTEPTAVEKVDLLNARVKVLENVIEDKNQKLSNT